MLTTDPDCVLDGNFIAVVPWHLLSSDELVRVVGKQQPACDLEDARDYRWAFTQISVKALSRATQDGE